MPTIQAWMDHMAADDLDPNTLRCRLATLSSLCAWLVKRQLLSANPVHRIDRPVRRDKPPAVPDAAIMDALIDAAKHRGLARAGLRLGEALALEWPDLDFADRDLRVARTLADGEAGTPKSGHGRTVDMSKELVAVLQRLKTDRKAETLRRGWSQMPALVFCSEVGTPLQVANVRRAFARTLKRAALPEHFTPHSLRHTFASLLLQRGESPVYVQRQLGHASIKLTGDTYGRRLPMGNKAAVDRLDGPSGSKRGSSGELSDAR